MSERGPHTRSPWPVGDGETAARVRDFDWTATSLGPIEHWPQCLKCAIEIISGSQVPMNIIWGAERILIYNEAHIAHLGQRHPRAFGRPARESWEEIWDQVEAIHRRVFTGERVTLEDQPWTILRNGVLTDTFFTTYFTPIRDEAGEVAGELITSFETTEAVKARRKLERVAQELRENEARLRTAAELVGLGWHHWNSNSKDVEWDARTKAMWGLSPDASVDFERAFAAIHPDDRYKVEEIRIAGDDPANHSHQAEFRVIGIEDGVERWIRSHGRTKRPGGPPTFIGAVLDITQQKLIELALRDREAKLQAAIDLVGLSIYSWDFKADIAEWDSRIRTLWGLGPDVKVDRALARSAVHPDDLPAFDAAVSRAMDPRGDGDYRVEYRVIGVADGVERWVSSYGKISFVAGAAVSFVGAVRDITDQKRGEAQLRESEERFRKFAENSSDVIWILNADQQRLEYLSPGFLPTWGAPPEEAIADIAIWNDSIHPEDRVARAQTLERVVAKGESMTHEYRIVRPDGSVRLIRDAAFPIRDAEGRIGQIGGIAHDISRREALSVYVVDPDTSTREAKSELLRRAGHRVTAFTTEAAFLDVAGALASGCVLVRTDDASPSRFELGRILNSRRIDLPVIFETDLGGDCDLAIGAMKAGAMDLLQAPAEPGMVMAAVASALANLRQEDLVEGAAEGARVQIALMSAREREVLDGLLAGGTNKTIARELGISPRTVEVHRARMMERLGAHTAQEAVMTAASAGMKPLYPRREGG